MKIAFNTLPLSGGHRIRGVGFYTKNLLEQLKKMKGLDVIEFAKLAEVKNVELIHYPFFDLFRETIEISKIPVVVTIHDLTPLIFPDAYPPGIRGKLTFGKQKRALRNVQAIMTDSENSKKDIIKYLDVEKSKVFPIHLAPAKHFKQVEDKKRLSKVIEKYNLPNKFALFVGDVNYNKNIPNLIKSVTEAGINLVICGKQATEIESLITSSRAISGPRDLARFIIRKPHPEVGHFREVLHAIRNSKQVIRLGFVSNEDLVVIYNLAQVLLLISFYEGFGLPILEAQACGTPVITSNISSMPEVAGEGAVFVNPYSVDQIAEAIRSATTNKKLRDKMIRKGFKNVKKFSWEKTAKETVKVYQYALRT